MNRKVILGIGILTIIAVVFFVWFMPQTEIVEMIKTEKGDIFFIVLASNPTTGYQWELEFDSNYIQLIDREYIPHEPDRIGGSGDETFEFLALKSGKTEITFSYLRPWLKEKESPLEKKVFKIIIE